MIELKATGICEHCPALDPELVKLWSSDNEGIPAAVAVRCRNEQLCRHLEMYISSDIVGSDPPKVEELDI